MHPWRCSHRVAAPVLAAALAVIVCLCMAAGALAGTSWFIDEARLHASAHTGISCTDCHAGMAEGGHPRIDAVGKAASSAFDRETCMNCHGDVEDGIAKGIHGGKPLEAGKDYAACIACHDPHAQLGARARDAGLTAKSDVAASCAACHEARADLPAPDADVAACLACHGIRAGGALAASPDKVGAAGKDAGGPQGPAMCLHCHGAAAQGDVRHMDAEAQASQTHGALSCLACHAKGAGYPHTGQPEVDCRTCHKARHDEATIHDPHTRVACGSCHLGGVTPKLADGQVGFVVDEGPLKVHTMKLAPGTASCARCHVPGNAVGATEDVLPPKGILCLGCHAGTFTVPDTPSRLGFGILVLGFLFMGAFWLAGANLGDGTPEAAAVPQEHGHTHGTSENRWIGLLCDVLAQRRLYRESPVRWGVHALIFFPFLFRCAWGIIAQFGSLWASEAEWPFVMLAKDWSVGALLFDASGLALLLGMILAMWRWLKAPGPYAGAPKRDWPAVWLLLAIVVTGFALEGIRIALTGMPTGSGYAFAGYALATCLADVPMATRARYHALGWQIHAIVTAVTVAYIPFSQLRHIVTTPISLLIQALRRR